MSTTADIRNGAVINFKNARMKIVEFQHVKPGKGPAFVRTKLKDIQSGKIIDHTFNSGAKIEFIRVTSRKFQYLYKDGDSFIFMDNNTYDQVQVDISISRYFTEIANHNNFTLTVLEYTIIRDPSRVHGKQKRASLTSPLSLKPSACAVGLI